jgi:hypothetical protein
MTLASRLHEASRIAGERTFIVVHINRLKRAHAQVPKASTFWSCFNFSNNNRLRGKQKRYKDDETNKDRKKEILTGIRAKTFLDNENIDDSDESQIEDNMCLIMWGQDDPEWKSSSSHLRRKSGDEGNCIAAVFEASVWTRAGSAASS